MRQLEDALGLRRERYLAEREGLGKARQRPLDLGLHRLQPQSQPLQDRGGNALPVPDQAEEDVLGTYEIVAETPRLFTRQDDHPTCPFGEPFKHRSPPHPFSVPFTQRISFGGRLVSRPHYTPPPRTPPDFFATCRSTPRFFDAHRVTCPPPGEALQRRVPRRVDTRDPPAAPARDCGWRRERRCPAPPAAGGRDRR